MDTFKGNALSFPFFGKRRELVEVYATLHAVTNIIKETQNNGVTGPLFVTEVCALMNNELDVTKPLEVHDPTPPLSAGGIKND